MKLFFLLLYIPFFLYTTEPEHAPLLPLEPQFPLYLSNQNRRLITFDEAERKRNIQILDQHAFPWLGLLGSVVLGLAGWSLIRFKQEKDRELWVKQEQVQKDQQFAESLAHLKANLDKTPIRESYLQLAELLGDCLSHRFHVRLMLYSPVEIGTLVDLLPLGSKEKNQLGGVLEKAYYVKFAKEEPSQQELEEALQCLGELIY